MRRGRVTLLPHDEPEVPAATSTRIDTVPIDPVRDALPTKGRASGARGPPIRNKLDTIRVDTIRVNASRATRLDENTLRGDTIRGDAISKHTPRRPSCTALHGRHRAA